MELVQACMEWSDRTLPNICKACSNWCSWSTASNAWLPTCWLWRALWISTDNVRRIYEGLFFTVWTFFNSVSSSMNGVISESTLSPRNKLIQNVIHILRVLDIQNQCRYYSDLIWWLLSAVYKGLWLEFLPCKCCLSEIMYTISSWAILLCMSLLRCKYANLNKRYRRKVSKYRELEAC